MKRLVPLISIMLLATFANLSKATAIELAVD